MKLHARDAGSHEEIQTVQCAGSHAHQDLVCADDGLGHVFIEQHVRPAVLVEPGGFHLHSLLLGGSKGDGDGTGWNFLDCNLHIQIAMALLD